MKRPVFGACSVPGTTLTFIGHRPPYEGHQLAASRRSVPGNDDQVWIWWMRPDGDSWQIADLVLNGRSAVSTEAHEYATVLHNNNGDMNALIAFMRKGGGQRSMYSPLARAGVILCVRVRRSRISQVMVR